jgi:hypothetical protein
MMVSAQNELKSFETEGVQIEPRFYLSIMKLRNYLYEESLAGRLSVVVSTQDITLSTESCAY